MATLRPDLLEHIQAQYARKDAQWGGQGHTPEYWTLILTEETGEAAKACIEGKAAEFAHELVDVIVAALGCLNEWTEKGDFS